MLKFEVSAEVWSIWSSLEYVVKFGVSSVAWKLHFFILKRMDEFN